MSDAIQQFRDALVERGIIPPANLRADGRLHRCDAEGRGGKNDAAYLLHLDGIPAGGFENWRDGLGWQTWHADMGRPLTAEERDAYRKRIDVARKQRETEEAQHHAEAREKANAIWAGALPCVAHAYLTRKGVQPYGVRVFRERLVLPIRDAAGILHSLQFIDAEGSKRFLSGGRIHGCYFSIGEPNGVLCIVEGMANGASIHEATKHAVVVAFAAGNLLAVARVLREQFPGLRLILCADDDYLTVGNPGKTKATEAALAVGGLMALPDFGDGRPEGATDFNDLHLAQGLDAVRRCIEGVLQQSPVMPIALPSAEVTADKPETVLNSTDEDIHARRCDWAGGQFEVSPDGVFFIGVDREGKEQPPRWICSPLHVVAKTRDSKSGEWGRLLEWRDDDGVEHQWAMPLELLQGDGSEVRRELARLGLSIAPGKPARDQLTSFLQLWPIEKRARCVDRLGWHGQVYVTPAESIGDAGEVVVFQNAHAIEPALSISGTIEEWRENVAALAEGNSRLVFALSVAFAGPLLGVVDEDSGGFHFRGASSSGKTTALRIAASVWGHPSNYPRLWRATVNGLEGLAALHNDGLLILDELSQIDPREAGDAAYLLANGQGKARASRSGTARQAAHWRLLFLSAGEESLAALMARAGRRTNAGQEIRLADIDSDAGADMGIFEVLHGQESPAALALALKDMAVRYHGAVGLDWLRHIVSGRPKLESMIMDQLREFAAQVMPKGADGQVSRVARRFALVAVAGEMATSYGLTGWPEGEAVSAAKRMFGAWLESFGCAGNREERAILDQVRAFFEAHGASRFEDMKALTDQRIPNRAGFWRTDENQGLEFFVFPEAFKRDICAGYDPRMATKVLLDAGWITPGKDGKATQKPRLPGLGPTRCYIFNRRMWED